MLLRYLLLHSEEYSNKTVMDLGAGMGVVGIGMAKYLNCTVEMTDYIPEVLQLAKDNVSFNKPYPESSGPPKVSLLDWNSHEDYHKQFEVIIGCELVYSITNC